MAETPVSRKLGLKPGMTLLVLGAPDGYERLLGEMPEEMTLAESTAVAPHAVHVFVRSLDELRERLRELGSLAAEADLVWVSYPKGRPKEEINRDSIWRIAEEHGLRPVSQVSVDEEWSAVRLRPVG